MIGMPDNIKEIGKTTNVGLLYYRLFSDFLKRITAKSIAFYSLETLSVISQLGIALIFLLLLRNLGIGDATVVAGEDAGYRAIIIKWAQILSLTQILMGLLFFLSVNAITSFFATRVINRAGREYEDFNVSKALGIISDMTLPNFIAINKYFPLDDRTSLQLLQSDVRMTAISARQLVRGSFSVVLVFVLLAALFFVSAKVSLIVVGFLLFSIIPLIFFFRAGMLHSFALLSQAPQMTRAKREIFQNAISQNQTLTPEDIQNLAAYNDGTGEIKKYMDEFEYRFQLVNNSSLAFDSLAKTVTILALFLAITLLGTNEIQYTTLIIIVFVLNLIVSAYRGLTGVASAISRYFVHVIKFRSFLEICERETKDQDENQSLSPYMRSSLPESFPLSLDISFVNSINRELKKGVTCALLMTGEGNKFKSFALYQNLFQTSDVYAWILNKSNFIHEIPVTSSGDIFDFLKIDVDDSDDLFPIFKDKLQSVIGMEVSIPYDRDWSDILGNKNYQIVTSIIGDYVFNGHMMFINAEVMMELDEIYHDSLYNVLDDGITFIYDRRAKPNISQLQEGFDDVILFDGARVSMMDKGYLFSLTHTEVMSYIKQEVSSKKEDDTLSMLNSDEVDVV